MRRSIAESGPPRPRPLHTVWLAGRSLRLALLCCTVPRSMSLILVTGGTSVLAQAIAARLVADGHAVRLTDRPGSKAPAVASESGVEWVECALDANQDTDDAVRGVSQIVHVEPVLQELDDWIDTCGRCVYNLLWAASDAGVSRCCVLSSMDLFLPYDPDIGVKFNFEPLPSTEPGVLGPHLSEFAAREFAMCGALQVVAARLGTLLSEPPSAQELSEGAHRWWVTVDEAAEELSAAATAAEAAGPVPMSSRHASIYDTVNLCHGDGLREGLSKQRADGGNPAWIHVPPPPAAATATAVASAIAADRSVGKDGSSEMAQRVLILGASGMLGPDVVECLSGDLPEHGGDASAEYRIRITDVTDRPQRRDDAQIERSDDNNQSSAASAPQSAETDPRHEYMSVDITNAEEVKAAAVGKQ